MPSYRSNQRPTRRAGRTRKEWDPDRFFRTDENSSQQLPLYRRHHPEVTPEQSNNDDDTGMKKRRKQSPRRNLVIIAIFSFFIYLFWKNNVSSSSPTKEKMPKLADMMEQELHDITAKSPLSTKGTDQSVNVVTRVHNGTTTTSSSSFSNVYGHAAGANSIGGFGNMQQHTINEQQLIGASQQQGMGQNINVGISQPQGEVVQVQPPQGQGGYQNNVNNFVPQGGQPTNLQQQYTSQQNQLQLPLQQQQQLQQQPQPINIAENTWNQPLPNQYNNGAGGGTVTGGLTTVQGQGIQMNQFTNNNGVVLSNGNGNALSVMGDGGNTNNGGGVIVAANQGEPQLQNPESVQTPPPEPLLKCDDFDGPTDQSFVDEMVYWEDYPADYDFVSPFYSKHSVKYITFEPDSGGWNSRRMMMETMLILAHATGRTLVLPPKETIPHMSEDSGSAAFQDFIDLFGTAMKYKGIRVMTMEEFLKKEALQGRLVRGNTVMAPPNGRVNWDSAENMPELWGYLRTVGRIPKDWDTESCLLAFPSTKDAENVESLSNTFSDIWDGRDGRKAPHPVHFQGRPVPVDAPAIERMREVMADRKELCLYDESLQHERLIHIPLTPTGKSQLSTHFYSFIFFEDWRHDVWAKRMIRDQMHYMESIICAAARVVEALEKSGIKEKDKTTKATNSGGITYSENIAQIGGNSAAAVDDGGDNSFFHAIHIRRTGDFIEQYPDANLDIPTIISELPSSIKVNSTLYIATDEQDDNNRILFKQFEEHFKVFFLSDFEGLLGDDLPPLYYGMVDQLVAARAKIFVGVYYSTFSGYINRLRGYYSVKKRLDGYRDGVLQSYYYAPHDKKKQMRIYRAIQRPSFMREYPVSWRDIDKGM